MEHQEARHIRPVMLDRNNVTSSPIHKKNNLAQASVFESGVKRSSCGTDDFPFQKPSSDKRNLVHKKLDFGAVHQASQAVPPVKASSIPQTPVRNINILEVTYNLIHKWPPPQELFSNDEERRIVSAALEIMKSEWTIEKALCLPLPYPLSSFDRLFVALPSFLILSCLRFPYIPRSGGYLCLHLHGSTM